jgi:hypothetical protein
MRLLGSMEVVGDDGAPLPVQGAKLRALLAMLALECGRVVSTEPRDDHDDHGGDVEKGEHDVVRDGQEPLHQGKPPVEIAGGVGIVVVKVNRLMIGGGGVPVIHEGDVGLHPIGEPLQLQVPVEPPPRILLAEQDHQQGGEEQQTSRTRRHHCRDATLVRLVLVPRR